MFERFYITNLGKALLAKAQAGAAIRFTKAQMGRGLLSSGTDIEALEALVTVVKDLPLTGAKAVIDSVTVTAQITNEGFSQAVWFREIGLFAEDPDRGEILYGYGNADQRADYIPAASESRYEAAFAVNCKIANAQQVTYTQQLSLVFLTRDDVIGLQNGGTGAVTAAGARRALKIQAGVANGNIGAIAPGAQATMDVVFPERFDVLPVVTLTGACAGDAARDGLALGVGARALDGFQIVVTNISQSAVAAHAKSVCWMAVEGE